MSDIRPTKAPVVLYSGRADEADAYRAGLTDAARREGQPIDLRMAPSEVEPEEVDYLVFAGSGPVRDFAPYSNLKAILSLWAGVEGILALDPPPDVPLVRMVEDGLTLGMVDYVMGHVLRHHLGMDRWIRGEREDAWSEGAPPLAGERRVGVLGLGELGAACAHALSRHGFRTAGWSRSEKSLPGIHCFFGPSGIASLLKKAEILVILLPHTPETEGLLDERRLLTLPEGAVVVNAARGRIIDDNALLDALDSGHIAHATLDVFDEEPLPDDHPFRRHDRVTVTPHIASVTRPSTASASLVRQIARGERGEPFKHVVDMGRGY